MNALEYYIQVHGLDPVATMNALTDAGLISDLCVGPETVAKVDCQAAIKFLKETKFKS